MDRGKTVDQASIIWQTGKDLPHCYDGGFATIFQYEPYQSHTFDKVSYSKRSEEFKGDTPCFMDEKYNPSFDADDKFILQVVQPIIRFPAQNFSPSIK